MFKMTDLRGIHLNNFNDISLATGLFKKGKKIQFLFLPPTWNNKTQNEVRNFA